ncbi:Fimbrial assembly family protein [Desulfofarcimen acetoxidans DSM 771]|uniref:Fimbrial assembly family protein n=1 Tax=Desulfofarcimen acetoxidans (strain ATCC 49208 / DSM 771 / KCTC 5769 / VKM B-1644 / 5575) TaxID=485916 RepID=C8W5I7_DESAS|nr:PilN domain-containing protein [Desulfofarcimen acetoxidans]ACV63987.1 Fimbrial assembly family protein [Desulfofarcimen acetoxidans DSM 771]
MDIRINLLPPELLGQQRKKQKRREQVFIGGIVLGVFLLVYAVLFIFTWQIESEAAALKKNRMALEAQVNANESYAVLQDKVAQADKLIGTALGTNADWTKIMTEINNCMPAGIRLTGFSVINNNTSVAAGNNPVAQLGQSVQGQKPVTSVTATTPNSSAPVAPNASTAVGGLDLQGLSPDHSTVGEWLEGMNKLSYLSDVRCQFSSEEDQEGQKMVRFEIKAALNPAGSQTGKAGGVNGN